jgi:hypothetical protein
VNASASSQANLVPQLAGLNLDKLFLLGVPMLHAARKCEGEEKGGGDVERWVGVCGWMWSVSVCVGLLESEPSLLEQSSILIWPHIQNLFNISARACISNNTHNKKQICPSRINK